MLKKKEIDKIDIVSLAVACIWWIITFFTDHLVFDALPGNGVIADIMALPKDSLAHFIICKGVLIVLIWHIVRFVCVALIRGVPQITRLLKFSAIYFVPIIAVLAFKLPQGFLSNDESLIFAQASALATYTWFYYLTTYYYIVTMMLIPSWLGPILVKVVLQVLVCGYCVARFSSYVEKNTASDKTKGVRKYLKYGLYVAFFLPPVLAYTTSAHRIPVYYLLYILMLFVLAMDRIEGVLPTKSKLFYLVVCGTLITQWRTEGIYMFALLPVLLILAYPSLRSIKRVMLLIVFCVAIQYLFSIPQNGVIADRLSDKADNRMGPFYAYTVTNMYRNGLDLEKNADDMEKIWRYLDKDTLKAINDDLKDINYEDVLILYYEGYTGKKDDATPEDYNEYVKGCKSLFINNPDVFIRTRIGAFGYAAMPYHLKWNQGGVKGLVLFAVSIVKTIAYNLYIPCLILLAFVFIFMLKRRWLGFFALAGLCCHFAIVFILAPASYFKYYFPIYMTGYFTLIFAILYIFFIKNEKR